MKREVLDEMNEPQKRVRWIESPAETETKSVEVARGSQKLGLS